MEIEIGQSVVVDDPDGPFTAKAASHCPGNLFFFFIGFDWLYCILLFNWFAHVGFVEIVKFCSYCWIFYIKCIWVWFYLGFELLLGFFFYCFLVIGFVYIWSYNDIWYLIFTTEERLEWMLPLELERDELTGEVDM